jgi:hypothetical protein
MDDADANMRDLHVGEADRIVNAGVRDRIVRRLNVSSWRAECFHLHPSVVFNLFTSPRGNLPNPGPLAGAQSTPLQKEPKLWRRRGALAIFLVNDLDEFGYYLTNGTFRKIRRDQDMHVPLCLCASSMG